jgi:outer membrane autotransporter protein
VNNTSGNLDLSNISGTGSLTKDGGGQLTLGGNNTYTGSTTINAGTVLLSVAVDTLPNTTALIVNGGTLNLNGTNQTVASLSGSGGTVDMVSFGLTVNGTASTTYAGTITSSGGDLTKSGSGTLTLTGNNTYSGGTDLNAGGIGVGSNTALGTGSLNMANGTTLQAAANVSLANAIVLTGTDTVDTQANALTLSGAITGTGGLTKIGSGTLTLTNTNTYAGATAINAGTLVLNGSIVGGATVASGATLMGTGTVGGGLTVSGTVAPGTTTTIGTLNVTGAFVQNAGSTYSVNVNSAGAADLITITGTATLNGGTVAVQAASGTYQRNTTYTILTATGGRTGTYSGVTSNFAFLTPSLSYSANSVMLNLLSSSNSFQNGGQTPNQRAVGAVLDQASPTATGDFANVLNAMFSLSTTQGPLVLQALSGQNYSAFSSLMVQSTQLFMDAFPFGDGADPDDQNTASLLSRSTYMALKPDCPPSSENACDVPPVWGVWGGGLGAFGTVQGDVNASGVTYNLGGFAAGIDRRFAPGFKAGVAAGFNAASLYTNGMPGYGTSNTLQFALYGEFKEGPFYFDALAGYGHSDNRMTRPINIPGLPFRSAQGYTTANTFFGELEAGYKLAIAPSFGGFVTPFARLQASTSTQNGFGETGADSLNLTVAPQTTQSLRTVLGAQFGASLDAPWRDKLKLVMRVGWSHDYADITRPVTASFAGAPVLAFTTFGSSAPRDGVVLGLGGSTRVAERTNIYLRYDGDLAGGNTNHILSAGVRYVW